MTTIGIIGGGQLGLMIAEQAALQGIETIALDPSADAPAFAVVNHSIVARFDDRAALEELCRLSDVVTYEFENVPGELLVELEKRYNIKQGFRPLFDSQDRIREKECAREGGLNTPAFEAADDRVSLQRAIDKIGYPCVVKTRTLGYDGHGQALLRSADDFERGAALTEVKCIVEQFVDFDYETSVIAVGAGDDIVTFPVGQNIHRDGILDLSIVPAPSMSSQTEQQLREQTKRFMRKRGYCGIVAVEYFVKGNEIYFNEMAPRPHNSGHWTIEGCQTNQFAELVRFLVGERLQQPQLKAPTIMKNILGRDLDEALLIESEHHKDLFVHIYGKSESRPLRKMGHITFTNLTLEQYRADWQKRFK